MRLSLLHRAVSHVSREVSLAYRKGLRFRRANSTHTPHVLRCEITANWIKQVQRTELIGSLQTCTFFTSYPFFHTEIVVIWTTQSSPRARNSYGLRQSRSNFYGRKKNSGKSNLKKSSSIYIYISHHIPGKVCKLPSHVLLFFYLAASLVPPRFLNGGKVYLRLYMRWRSSKGIDIHNTNYIHISNRTANTVSFVLYSLARLVLRIM